MTEDGPEDRGHQMLARPFEGDDYFDRLVEQPWLRACNELKGEA